MSAKPIAIDRDHGRRRIDQDADLDHRLAGVARHQIAGRNSRKRHAEREDGRHQAGLRQVEAVFAPHVGEHQRKQRAVHRVDAIRDDQDRDGGDGDRAIREVRDVASTLARAAVWSMISPLLNARGWCSVPLRPRSAEPATTYRSPRTRSANALSNCCSARELFCMPSFRAADVAVGLQAGRLGCPEQRQTGGENPRGSPGKA